ncbi:MAG: DUF1015 domain-containing protein [Spirochaetia bacterium]|jgi:hypothetical protein|nr:DUF1015 domain-containing protein [Spirochaetia bacterium]
MNNEFETLKKLGLGVPEVLLPDHGLDYGAWAVVACDQYSSEREYWERVREFVGDKPSALNLIFPECYLDDEDAQDRIGRIHGTMNQYLREGYLKSPGKGFVLVERSTAYVASPRLGLLVLLDLERYDFNQGSKSLIRPTEGTILSRLPPRMAIRRAAALELPHVMVLVDDPGATLIEALYRRREYYPRLYDFQLMEGGGHVRAWFLNDQASIQLIDSALQDLADPEAFARRQGSGDPLLFAVGDGNHSLATAKAIWEETKAGISQGAGTESEKAALLKNHPARYALAEIVNIHDKGLPFHPIHRVLFNLDSRDFFRALEAEGVEITQLSEPKEAFLRCDQEDPEQAHRAAWVTQGRAGLLRFTKPRAKLAVGSLQDFLDRYLKTRPGASIDYIHGSGSLLSLASKPGSLGIYCPPIDKDSFFSTIVKDGVMPRKSFSMGEAAEKRFYIEARRITNG